MKKVSGLFIFGCLLAIIGLVWGGIVFFSNWDILLTYKEWFILIWKPWVAIFVARCIFVILKED